MKHTEAAAAQKQPEPGRPTLSHPIADGLPIRERLSVTVNVAAQFTGISRSRVYELLHDGTLNGKLVAGRRVVLVDSLLRLVGEAPSAKREPAAA